VSSGARALVAARGIPAEEPLTEDFLGVYCENVIRATDEICNWVA